MILPGGAKTKFLKFKAKVNLFSNSDKAISPFCSMKSWWVTPSVLKITSSKSTYCQPNISAKIFPVVDLPLPAIPIKVIELFFMNRIYYNLKIVWGQLGYY